MAAKSTETRYFFAQDNDCHWYMVNANFVKEWREWFDSEDYQNGYTPHYARVLGGGIESITFEKPNIGNGQIN